MEFSQVQIVLLIFWLKPYTLASTVDLIKVN